LATASRFPSQPSPLTNREVVQAFQQAARALKIRNGEVTWLRQAGLQAIGQKPNDAYTGPAIASLNLEDEVKLTILSRLIASKVTVTPASPTPPPATPSRPKGRFTVQGTQFLLDGKPFRFVGVNVRELAYYGFSAWTNGHARPEHIDAQLQSAKQMRAQVFRIYAPFSRNAKGEERTDTQEAIRRIKLVLDKAQKLNMFALISLDDAKQSGFHVATTDNGRYREPGFISNMAFYHGGYQERYLPFVKELVGALGGHPALFAWGVCNETQVNPFIPPTPPDSDCEAFLNYYKTTSETIKALAPGDLVTTSIECARVVFVANAYTGKKYANRLYTLPSIDFATLHSYQDWRRMDNVLGHNDEDGRMELDLARTVWKKPVVIEEMGPVRGEGGSAPGRDGTGWTANALAKWFELGAAGAMQWGFSAMTDDVGVGDADAGMHNVGNNPHLPGNDWGGMFSVYQHWGNQFWAGA
jgi:hypothetical protein